MAALQPDEVRFLSFEGGGRAGLVIHPGMAQALEELEVLRYDHGRQVGVEGFSGSSSGSMVATLMSCGYRYHELFELLSEGAFDLVFRLEEFQLGQFSKLNGACSPPRPEPPPTVILHSEAFADPVGALLHILMRTSSFYQAPLLQAGALAMVWKDEVSLRIARLSAGEDQPGWLRQAAGIAKDELERSLRSMQVPWGKTHILEWIERTYPHVVFKLFEHMLRDTAASDPNNLFHVFKRDFAFFAGCAWRDYIDHMVSFARFRARFAAMLPDLRVPTEADFNAAGSLQQVFFDRIKAAEATAVLEAQESPPDFAAEYERLRNTTFEQHRADLYPDHGADGPPPLVMSGANLSSQESHLFSAVDTPWLCVADAVRIATSLPPLFKPVVLEPRDLPSSFPRITDLLGTSHFLEGYWMDGGLYWNSPFDVFQDYEAPGSMTLGVGIGIPTRTVIADITDFLTSMVNVVGERNISATRSDLTRFVVVDNRGIKVFGPRMTASEITFARLYGRWAAHVYFGNLDPGPPPPPPR